MIVVDASAILAIVFQEEDLATHEYALANSGPALMSPVNYWECLVAARGRLGDHGDGIVDEIISRMSVSVVDVDIDIARSAADAFARYKGRAGGRLNLGDCFAYALAQREGDGLLFKGNDFPKTDVRSVL